MVVAGVIVGAAAGPGRAEPPLIRVGYGATPAMMGGLAFPSFAFAVENANADLTGKRVAVPAFGTGSDGGLRIFLKSKGLEPGKDVKRPPEAFEGWVFTKEAEYRDPWAMPDMAAFQRNVDQFHEVGFLPRKVDAGKFNESNRVSPYLVGTARDLGMNGRRASFRTVLPFALVALAVSELLVGGSA